MRQDENRIHSFEIGMGTMDEVGEAINGNATEERAPQRPAGISRNMTAEIQRVVNFQSPRELWDSLPIVSKLFMLATFIDVALVIGYSVWQFSQKHDLLDWMGDGADEDAKKEHLHVVLGMLVSATFWVMFVIEAISQENDFELLACIVLTVAMAGRVAYIIVVRKVSESAMWGGLSIVVMAALVTVILGFMTYNKFGWRVYSRIACDLRVKNAAVRTLIYFAKNRFNTLLKLDFQFLVLNTLVGIVMSFQKQDENIVNNTNTLVLFVCTVAGLILGLTWCITAYYAVRNENPTFIYILSILCFFISLCPIASVVVVYVDNNSTDRTANESLAISTGFLVFFRILASIYMVRILKLVNSREGKSEKSEAQMKIRMSSKHPDLLPLLKGAWLIKQSASAPNKRRFFQLSQDFTSLRWAWNSYVLLYYVENKEPDDENMTIKLTFSMEPDLVVKFEDLDDYQTWNSGFDVVLALLFAPDNQIENKSKIAFKKNPLARTGKKATTPIEVFLRQLGVYTTRHRTFGSMHPEVEARQELKRIKSGGDGEASQDRNKNNRAGVNQLKGKTSQEGSADDSNPRQSTRIASGRMHTVPEAYSNEPLSDSQATSNDEASSHVDENLKRGTENHALGLNEVYMAVETIEYSDLEFGKLLGTGAEGAVWAAWYLDTPVAVKKTDSANEQTMLRRAGQHDNIVGLRGFAREGSSTYIVLEYCPRGTLDVLIHHTMNAKWDLKKVLQMVRGIARGILHLHTRKPAMLHRDIKPANVFLSHGLVLKIGDFGMSREVLPVVTHLPSGAGRKLKRTLTPGVVGTGSYAAPELLDERYQTGDYDAEKILKADVYSFGVTMWEMVERKRSCEGMQFYEIIAGWASDPKSMELEKFTIRKDLNMIDQTLWRRLQDLTIECTKIRAEERPTMRQVVKKLKDIHIEVERTSGDIFV